MTVTAASLKSSPESPDASGPPKKSKKKLFMILGVLVLLIGGYEAKSILLQPHYRPGQPVPAGKILPLDQLTIAMSDGHMVQVTVALQLTTAANMATINADIPRFEDAATTVFGAETYSGLLPPSERARVKGELLGDCQRIAGTVDGAAEQISAIYFTGFIEQ